MQRLEQYFKGHAEQSHLFKPEWSAAVIINQFALKEKVGSEDLEVIANILNATNEVPHHGGSAWIDFTMHIKSLIKSCGYEYKIAADSKIEILKKQ